MPLLPLLTLDDAPQLEMGLLHEIRAIKVLARHLSRIERMDFPYSPLATYRIFFRNLESFTD